MSLPEDRASESLADPLAGTPYRLLGVLGRGGMGEIFEAEHVLLGRRVVVKVLHENLAQQPTFIERMRIEAQALARLSHPNLTVVTDLGATLQGRPYFVMERLHGRTLREELQARGALPALEVIDIALQLLAALAHVHARGLIHRDIKPDNLFWCAEIEGRRTLKLLDFGIAKVLATGSELSGAPRPLAVPTQEGTALGTPRFLSPEQALGSAVDARADIYGTGGVLYCLLTGRDPFAHHRSLGGIIRAHLNETPAPPSKHTRKPLPEALDRAVLRALEKRPEDRFPSAGSLAAELATIALSLEGSSTTVETDNDKEEQRSLNQEDSPCLRAPELSSGTPSQDARCQVHEPEEHLEEDACPSRDLVSGRGGGMESTVYRPGERCQRYEIVRLLGSGGFSEVYAVADEAGTSFALKVLKLRFRHNPDLVERFYREAAVLKAIEHINVVRFTDAGIDPRSMIWIVMERLHGTLLRDYMHNAGGRLSVETAFRFARQLCKGAAAAHAAQVIHRDLKPDNVMVVPGDILKIFDFGLAKIQNWGLPTTQPGSTFGTPTYMAPEQCDGRGRKPDARTDVYAIGLVLYEMLWGAHPFASGDGEFPTQAQAITMQIAANITPLPERLAGFPGYLSAVIERALEKEPDARWPSARDFSEAIGVALKRYLRETRDAPVAIPLPAPAEPIEEAVPLPELRSFQPVVITEPLALPRENAPSFSGRATVRPPRRAFTEPLDLRAPPPSPAFAAAAQHGSVRAPSPPLPGPALRRPGERSPLTRLPFSSLQSLKEIETPVAMEKASARRVQGGAALSGVASSERLCRALGRTAIFTLGAAAIALASVWAFAPIARDPAPSVNASLPALAAHEERPQEARTPSFAALPSSARPEPAALPASAAVASGPIGSATRPPLPSALSAKLSPRKPAPTPKRLF